MVSVGLPLVNQGHLIDSVKSLQDSKVSYNKFHNLAVFLQNLYKLVNILRQLDTVSCCVNEWFFLPWRNFP
jgi:hypothetical protein